eukprot:2567954-Prymnesium_polylepis.1
MITGKFSGPRRDKIIVDSVTKPIRAVVIHLGGYESLAAEESEWGKIEKDSRYTAEEILWSCRRAVRRASPLSRRRLRANPTRPTRTSRRTCRRICPVRKRTRRAGDTLHVDQEHDPTL